MVSADDTTEEKSVSKRRIYISGDSGYYGGIGNSGGELDSISESNDFSHDLGGSFSDSIGDEELGGKVQHHFHEVVKPVPVIVPKHIPVEVIKHVPVPVRQPVPVPFLRHVPYPVPHPVRVVHERRIPVPVTRPVPYPVPHPVPVHVPRPVLVPVHKPVPVYVGRPYAYPVLF